MAIMAGAVFLFRPVCVAIPDADLANFSPPIETRRDRGLYFSTFQFRDGRWWQCKTWLERWGFS